MLVCLLKPLRISKRYPLEGRKEMTNQFLTVSPYRVKKQPEFRGIVSTYPLCPTLRSHVCVFYLQQQSASEGWAR